MAGPHQQAQGEQELAAVKAATLIESRVVAC